MSCEIAWNRHDERLHAGTGKLGDWTGDLPNNFSLCLEIVSNLLCKRARAVAVRRRAAILQLLSYFDPNIARDEFRYK